LEIHPSFFLIKDQVLRRIHLSGRSRRGLYPIPSTSEIKRVLGVFHPSSDQWHNRLGHPSSTIVANIIHSFNLPVLGTVNKNSVYSACQ
jgi:hypothetical protein